MIEGSIAIFPNNILAVSEVFLSNIDPDVPVIKRRLYSTDPVQAIGVSAYMWTPDPSSYEMRGPGLAQVATIQRYDIHFQSLIRDMDEVRGLARHAELTKLVQLTVMANSQLRAALHDLTSTLYGVTERLKKWNVENSRYLAEEVQGEHIYLSTTTVRVETET